MEKPIGIIEAASVAKTTRAVVHRAMETNRLNWKALGGNQVTTKRWVRQWLSAAAC